MNSMRKIRLRLSIRALTMHQSLQHSGSIWYTNIMEVGSITHRVYGIYIFFFSCKIILWSNFWYRSFRSDILNPNLCLSPITKPHQVNCVARYFAAFIKLSLSSPIKLGTALVHLSSIPSIQIVALIKLLTLSCSNKKPRQARETTSREVLWILWRSAWERCQDLLWGSAWST